jgi:hypothetical protein
MIAVAAGGRSRFRHGHVGQGTRSDWNWLSCCPGSPEPPVIAAGVSSRDGLVDSVAAGDDEQAADQY